MKSEFGLQIKPVEGSDGKASEVWRCFRLNMQVGGLVKKQISKIAAQNLRATAAEPLQRLKADVEDLLDSYTPTLAAGQGGDGMQLLTWRGHLRRLALEAALGVRCVRKGGRGVGGGGGGGEGRRGGGGGTP